MFLFRSVPGSQSRKEPLRSENVLFCNQDYLSDGSFIPTGDKPEFVQSQVILLLGGAIRCCSYPTIHVDF